MRRLRLAALLAVVGAGMAAPADVLAGSGGEKAMSSGSSRAAGTAAGATFTLQQATEKQCKALSPPARVLGKGCVDDAGMVVQEAWSVNDGNASRDTEQYQTSYQWKIPPTIKAGGSITLLVKGHDKKGALHCPALAVAGDFARAQIYKCAEGGATLNESLKVKLVPPAGGTAKLMVWVTDGPDYTYFYRAGAAPPATTPKCRAPIRLPASVPAGEKKCRYFVSFEFDVLKVVPEGRVETTRGGGGFYVRLSDTDTRACSDEVDVKAIHRHEPVKGSDYQVVLGDNAETRACLTLKGRGAKTLTATIKLSQLSGFFRTPEADPGCKATQIDFDYNGALDVRAGPPFNYVHLDFKCKHREKYGPPGVEADRRVDTKINISIAKEQ